MVGKNYPTVDGGDPKIGGKCPKMLSEGSQNRGKVPQNT